MSDTAELATVFDADNHYWEASDAFTRYRSPEFAERGVLVREVDGRMRYVVHGDLHPWIPGPGDVNPGRSRVRFSTAAAGRSQRCSRPRTRNSTPSGSTATPAFW